MRALILNIGNEVLSGKVVNTNSSFLAKELNKIGIITEKVVVVGDDEDAINKEINDFKQSHLDILITTGGLGPTHDDLTKEVLSKNLNLRLELDNDSLSHLQAYFDASMSQSNLKQAYFPKEAMIIPNHLGTANGAIISLSQKLYVILVGPPQEMIPMVNEHIIPYLRNISKVEVISQEYIVMGNGESYFEDFLSDLMKIFPRVSLAPYASIGKIRYLVTAKTEDEEDFKLFVKEFESLMADYIISKDNEEIEEVLVKALKARNYTISFAESCTGGMLASRIINVPGASRVIGESLVTYSNDAKIKYLNVNEDTINHYGVVSDQVVIEMVDGLKKKSKANIAVSVSGIAGPTGGSVAKPVGLVHYAIKINNQLFVESKVFKGNREMIRTRTTLWVLYRIYYHLLKNDENR